MIAALILTWIVPSGQFETIENEAGREVVVPGSFDTIQDKEYLPITALFTVVPRAFADAQGIIFFVLIIFYVFGCVRWQTMICSTISTL